MIEACHQNSTRKWVQRKEGVHARAGSAGMLRHVASQALRLVRQAQAHRTAPQNSGISAVPLPTCTSRSPPCRWWGSGGKRVRARACVRGTVPAGEAFQPCCQRAATVVSCPAPERRRLTGCTHVRLAPAACTPRKVHLKTTAATAASSTTLTQRQRRHRRSHVGWHAGASHLSLVSLDHRLDKKLAGAVGGAHQRPRRDVAEAHHLLPVPPPARRTGGAHGRRAIEGREGAAGSVRGGRGGGGEEAGATSNTHRRLQNGAAGATVGIGRARGWTAGSSRWSSCCCRRAAMDPLLLNTSAQTPLA